MLPFLLTNLDQMDSYDDPMYIQFGKELAEGKLPVLGQFNPLLAAFHAMLYEPLKDSAFWMVYVCRISRIIFFCLLWLIPCLIARQMPFLINPLIIFGFLFVSPALAGLVFKSSDAFFAVIAGLALWQMLAFYRTERMRHLGLTSFFLGLAALSRNDGWVLFLIFVFLAALLSASKLLARKNLKAVLTTGAACLIPFGVVVASYLLFYFLQTGRFAVGTKARTYQAFQAAQGVVFREAYKGKNPWVDGVIDAERLYGSRSENQNSVFKAIRRNPEAFCKRVKHSLKMFPGMMISAYGKWLGVLLFLLAILGSVELIKRREYQLLAIFSLWPLSLATYFIFYFRPGFFLFHYFVVVVLGAVGLNSLATRLQEKKFYGFTLLTLGALSLLLRFGRSGYTRLDLLAVTAFLALGITLARLILLSSGNKNAAMMTILCLALILRGPYPSPDIWPLGRSPEEKAALFMRKTLKPASKVLSYQPRSVWFARMSFVSAQGQLRGVKSDREFLDWLRERQCKAIYVDGFLKKFEPAAYALIQRQLGKSLEVAFTSDDQSVQILRVKDET